MNLCHINGMARRLAAPLLLAVLLLANTVPAQSPSVGDPAAKRAQAVSELTASFRANGAVEAPRVAQNQEAFVRYLGAPAPGVFPVAAPSPDAEAMARAFLQERSGVFFAESAAVGFDTVSVKTVGERCYVKLQQTYSGIPVWGGQMVIQTKGSEGVAAVLCDVMKNATVLDRGFLPLQPSLGAQQAQDTAIVLMAPEYGADALQASAAQLMIYDPSLIDLDGRTRLVWQTVVTHVAGPIPREFVLVDALTGEIVLHFTLITDAGPNRAIYDADSTSADPGTLVRSEGQPPCGIADADTAYAYYGDTYSFYLTENGRHSIDNAGMTMSATVRYCPSSDECPYQNAFWNGARMYFGAGFVVDDVVAHELTHGVTQYESNLIYYGQSGAINESLSDMWGEWIDQNNGSGNDTAAVKWLLGEDIPGIGAIRNMANPPQFNDPDRLSSSLYYLGIRDGAGVHTNSGVGNKLCFLLTDGQSFNGQTVTGMGYHVATDLMYECQTNLLTSASNYYDLGSALIQACDNLSLGAAQKDNVIAACHAVEIVPSISAVFDVTYKDKNNGAIAPSITDDVIAIRDPAAVGTLSIKRKKGVINPMMIREVITSGSLTKLFTQAPIQTLQVDGQLKSLTASECYVGRTTAGEIGTVKMSIKANNIFGGQQYYAIINSGMIAGDFVLTPGPAPLAMKVQLAGVCLNGLTAPNQVASINLSSLVWSTKEHDVTLGYAGVYGSVIAREIPTLKTSGAWIIGHDITAMGSTSKPSSIAAAGKFLKAKLGSYVLPIYYFGYLGLGGTHIASGAAKLSASATGGDLLPAEILAAGEITKLSSKYFKAPWGTFYGGFVRSPSIKSGATLVSSEGLDDSVGAAAPSKDIKYIYADLGVNSMYNGTSATLTLTNEIHAAGGCDASIKKIATRKIAKGKVPQWIIDLDKTFIAGTGFTKDEPIFVNGNHSYFTVVPCP